MNTFWKIVRLLIYLAFVIFLFCFFGNNFFTTWVLEKLILTTDNIVWFTGMILFSVLAAAGIYASIKIKKIFAIILSIIINICSWISTACSITIIFGFDLKSIIIGWIILSLKGIGLFILKIILGIIGLFIVIDLIFAICFGIYTLFGYIVEKITEQKYKNIPKSIDNQQSTTDDNLNSIDYSTQFQTPLSLEKLTFPEYQYQKKSYRICPRCGGKMVIRHRHSDGKPFWGCSNYFLNDCRYTLDF